MAEEKRSFPSAQNLVGDTKSIAVSLARAFCIPAPLDFDNLLAAIDAADKACLPENKWNGAD
jgi:hypothetical protein